MALPDQIAALAEASQLLEDDLNEIDAQTTVRRLVIEALPTAISGIINLASHASNERVRFNACVWLVERGAPVGSSGGDSPIDRLINDINEEAVK